MRRLLPRGVFLFVLAACILCGLGAQSLPRPAGFVNDFAGVMRPEDARAAENLAAAVKQKTGAELALVTVKSYAPYGSIDEFSLALAEAWGIGEKGKDTGVLLVLAMSERKVRIEAGYGLEGAIPDSVAGRILDTAVIPAFRAGDFSGGLVKGLGAIAALVAKEKGVSLAGIDVPKAEEAYAPDDFGELFSLFGALLFGGNGFLGIFVFIIIMRLLRGARRIGIFRSGGFGRGGGSFGGSGGFRGFGGGGFGGGGASRGF
ncbi:MAG: TPM domain-containing protein [Spirochaetaceae bacterium]|nr:TPM domain-containing protein [Spirochaetaceae bacterium]